MDRYRRAAGVGAGGRAIAAPPRRFSRPRRQLGSNAAVSAAPALADIDRSARRGKQDMTA
jgi:hypothetical protein